MRDLGNTNDRESKRAAALFPFGRLFRSRLWFRRTSMPNVQHHRQSCDAVDAGLQIKRSARFWNPLRGRNEELSLALAFQKHQAVQSDIVDKYAVRHVASGIFFAKLDKPGMIKAINL
jgi:hypothetical protein